MSAYVLQEGLSSLGAHECSGIILLSTMSEHVRLSYTANSGTAEQSESGGGGLKFSEVAILLYY